jgi:hypothetical protein
MTESNEKFFSLNYLKYSLYAIVLLLIFLIIITKITFDSVVPNLWVQDIKNPISIVFVIILIFAGIIFISNIWFILSHKSPAKLTIKNKSILAYEYGYRQGVHDKIEKYLDLKLAKCQFSNEKNKKYNLEEYKKGLKYLQKTKTEYGNKIKKIITVAEWHELYNEIILNEIKELTHFLTNNKDDINNQLIPENKIFLDAISELKNSISAIKNI